MPGDVGPMIEGTGLRAVFSLERAEPRLGGATGLLAEEMEEVLGGEQEALELLEELPSLGGVEADPDGVKAWNNNQAIPTCL